MSSNNPQQAPANLTLEIRHLDVTGGDSTLIFVKNNDDNKILYKLLIDAGAEGGGGARLVSYLAALAELKEKVNVGGSDEELPVLDCIVATHYHLDHIEGFTRFGGAGILFRRYLDNGGYTANGNLLTPRNDVGKNVKRTTLFGQYTSTVQNNKVGGQPAQRVALPFIAAGADLTKAAPVVLRLGENTGVTLTCYCANGILADGTNVLGTQRGVKNREPSPNDVSLAFVLEWDDFRYFTAGDLSGDPTLQSYFDIETGLVNYLAGGPLKNKPVTVLRVSHHGSEHSNQDALFAKLKPKLIVVSCNTKKKVPSPVFLARLKTYLDANAGAKVVFVNELFYLTTDDRYAAMDAIKGSIVDGNVVFKNVPDKGDAVSNIDIKTAHVRRKTGGAVGVALDDASFKTVVLDKMEVVLGKRPANEADTLVKSQKPSAFKLDYRFSVKDIITNSGNTIMLGFAEQAAQMVGWLANDAEQAKTIGRDYIALHYPELVAVLEDKEPGDELEAALAAKMGWLFDQAFTVSDGLYKLKSNDLSSDARETLDGLLAYNKYQFNFNRSSGLLQDKNLFKSEYEPFSWNGRNSQYPEPYAGEDAKGKRKAELDLGSLKTTNENE